MEKGELRQHEGEEGELFSPSSLELQHPSTHPHEAPPSSCARGNPIPRPRKERDRVVPELPTATY